MSYLIDGLQYSNWSEKIFRQIRAGGVDAVHVTLVYHENFRETVANIERWNRWFERWPEMIFQGFTAQDIATARATGRTAVFFGAQNPSCIEDDIGLVEVLHRLGLRFTAPNRPPDQMESRMTAQTAAYPADKLRWVKTPTRNAENDNQPVADTVAKVLALVMVPLAT